ncbi:MAG: helix-turn-helix transcriptional regulator, partial [Gammaproteobacteria bacterium]
TPSNRRRGEPPRAIHRRSLKVHAHGYDVRGLRMVGIEHMADDLCRAETHFPEGTIYPALYRLESLEFLESSAETVAGRVRRTYRVTRAGRVALKERETSWREFVRGVEAVLSSKATGHA